MSHIIPLSRVPPASSSTILAKDALKHNIEAIGFPKLFENGACKLYVKCYLGKGPFIEDIACAMPSTYSVFSLGLEMAQWFLRDDKLGASKWMTVSCMQV